MSSASQSMADMFATEMQLGAHDYKPLDVVLSRGMGVWVWDVDGNRYLDCLAALGGEPARARLRGHNVAPREARAAAAARRARAGPV